MAKGSRRPYYAVLALAGGALVLDRVFSDGPRAARADAGSPTDLAVPASERAQPPVASADTAAVRLAAFATGGARDGELGKVPAWLAPPPEAKPVPAAPAEKPWADRHKLTSFSRGQKVGVMLDGRFVEVGKKVDGMVLSAVDTEARAAVFLGVSGEARIPLPLPRLDPSENDPAAAGAK